MPLLPATLFLFFSTAVAAAAEFYVSPEGNDAHPGTKRQPFATLERARDAARRARKPGQDAVISLGAGVHRLARTLELDARDSRTSFVGGPGAELSGGVDIPAGALRPVTDPATLARLPGARVADTRLYEIRLGDLGLPPFPERKPFGMGLPGSESWPELFLNETPLRVAGWPNAEGYAAGFKPTRVIEAATNRSITAGGASATAETRTAKAVIFAYDSPRTARWKSARDTFGAELWMGGHWFWDWADACVAVAGIDANGVITTQTRPGYGIGKHVNLRVLNLAEEMDLPGEYALEPARGRILVLLGREQVRGRLTLSWLGGPLVTIQKASDLHFRQLHFSESRADAVRIQTGARITFERCLFSRLGGTGIVAEGTGIEALDCRFTQTGAGGVAMTGGDRTTLTRGNNRVAHCEFSAFSRIRRTYTPGVSVRGVGMTVENCLFFNAPHSAILFGGNEHLIRNNEIRDVLKETGDCGAIYGGRDWTTHGTVISGNWIHHLGGRADRWCNGIYLDDCMSGITVRGNLLEGIPLGAMIGGGRHNEVTGNIFLRCENGIQLDSRGVGWMKEPHPNMATMKATLASLRVTEQPWASRYPMLKDTLTHEYGKPVGTRITHNAFVACKTVWHHRSPAGVAVVDPNWENLPADLLIRAGGRITVRDTPLVFIPPRAGVR